MATIRKNILSAVVAIALVAVTLVSFAVKSASNHVTAKLDPVSWYFIGDELSDATTASAENWTTEDPELGCGLGTAVPCELIVEGATDLDELQLFLNGKTATQIRDTYASSKRAE